MKKCLAVLFLILAAAGFANAQSQNSNSVTVTVIAPANCAITVSPSSYYQNLAATMTIGASGCAAAGSSCSAKWDTTALPLTFASATTSFSASVTATMTASTGSHTVIVSCPLPQLSMNSPLTLPNAKAGTAYSADLKALSGLAGGIPPYSFSLSSGSLPAGLSLSSGGLVSGTPSGVGSFNFGFTVVDASGAAILIRAARTEAA